MMHFSLVLNMIMNPLQMLDKIFSQKCLNNPLNYYIIIIFPDQTSHTLGPFIVTQAYKTTYILDETKKDINPVHRYTRKINNSQWINKIVKTCMICSDTSKYK